MIRLIKIATFTLMALCLAQGAFAASLYAPGLNCTDIPVNTQGYITGFDLLPNGDYVINDGYTISEISRDGSSRKTFYTFATPVYGSFVRYNPADGKVYFAESSNGVIRSFSYSDPSNVSTVATIPYNFDMDFSGGVPYVVAANSSWSQSLIYQINGSTTDLIASCAGPTGPIAFDGSGNLFYIPATLSGSTNILEWSSMQVAGAVGPSSLSQSSAQALANIEGGYGSTFEPGGGFIFSNNGILPSEIQVYQDGNVSTIATFAEPGGKYGYISIVRADPIDNGICAITSWDDASGASHTVISSLAIPEPSSLLALCSLIGLAGTLKLLRFSGK